MKNIRLFYRKNGRAKYISHLDTTRFMTRVIRRAGIPVWYTEGFNPHPYMTFALPLSLGCTSDYEVLDIRLTDDGFDVSNLCDTLNAFCPSYIKFFEVSEPVRKVADLCYARFEILIEGEIEGPLNSFLSKDQIIVSKKTKKGGVREIDVASKIKTFDIKKTENGISLNIVLPAGSSENINPELILKTFFDDNNLSCYYEITRKELLDIDMQIFK